MGKPGGSNVPSSVNESIVHEKGTRGTETSKYPEEKKEKSISSVAASESERAQTIRLRLGGVVGQQHARQCLGEEFWKGLPKRVRGPYPKSKIG